MKKTVFFTGETTEQLQQKVNSWLSENKDIGVIESGMSSGGDGVRAAHSFYLLYEAVHAAEAVAIAAQLENVIPESGVMPDTSSLSETSDAQLQ